jgi:ketosteroid isomerase-like protein
MRPAAFALLAALGLGSTLGLPAGGAHAQTAGPAQSQALTEEVSAADAAFFDAFFNRCDLDTVGAMLTEDMEFFHDKHGQGANSGAQFLEAIKGTCARQAAGVDYRARRELIVSTSEVWPMNNYGALHTGTHRFFKKEKDGSERLVEVSRFANLWKREGGRWKLARVISYGHELINGQ